MKTSYFSNIKNLPEGSKIFSIARGNPKWYKGAVYLPLAPSWELIKNTACPEPYTQKYKEQVLNKLDPQKVYKELGENAVLLCWETPNDFCHRRIVADWFKEKLGIEVPEFQIEVVKVKKPQQMGLGIFNTCF